jgi:hypothetical protein
VAGVLKVRAVSLWQKQMPENWAACGTFLERRHPGRWAKKRDGQTFNFYQDRGKLPGPDLDADAEEQRRLLRDPAYAAASADLVHRRRQLAELQEPDDGSATKPGNGEPPPGAPPA